MGISHYIKEIGRGARGAKPLTREQARDLFGQVLDGTVSDLEVGAFCIAMRIKGETVDEMCGFLDAIDARIHRANTPQGHPTVVIPSYNGARRLPLLTPLLALLLARQGLPVLIHGMRTEAQRTVVADVFEALDMPPLTSPDQPLAPGQVGYLHTAQLHQGLARLLSVREIIGLRNPAHSAVKLMQPCTGPSVLLSSYTHPEYVDMVTHTLSALGRTALLSRGLEGEVSADPRRTARTVGVMQGQVMVLQEQQPGTASTVPGLPTAIDATTTAQYTRDVLQGHQPIPDALAQQVQHIVQLAQQPSPCR